MLWTARSQRCGEDDYHRNLGGSRPGDFGEVEVLGYRWGEHDDEIRQQIGISLQETILSEKLSVRETLALFRSFYRQGLEPDEAIRLVSLEEKADSWVKKLSGGQKQRLAVACSLVGDPTIVVSGRTDDGPRSAVATAAMGGDSVVSRLGADRALDDALYG